ncbi:hypothetical protein BC939DRAFT_454153 [Gamsiella multidivaricata]|uniref:uncharacterized protein n=1 Tax=Gamsiella multidivaricata TaxID=101098 RepID=UPI0022200664|nr:uncharacterized protein BC939DRAFT_454153 [Gamsiella multidivaricata]KAG0368269.1 hypothetical protein BGZ54_002316 [Gamsiella multidivaricata]KAI7822155.1 hypothetical protein BC939DRAFT_454153 [Gamsiella multidivaricata]
MLKKTFSSALPAIERHQQQQQARAFSVSTLRQEQEKHGENNQDTASNKRAPYRTARYLLEIAERQQRGRGNFRDGPGPTAGAPDRRSNFRRSPRSSGEESSNNTSGNRASGSRFQPQPTIAYNTTKELQFADKIDWEVTSVTSSRPLYANVAAGRGMIAPLGTAAINSTDYNPILPGTVFSAHVTGVRADGDLDPEVEQGLIQDLAAIQDDKDKDHRKKSDVSVENQPFLLRMTQNYQEIINPRNAINRFNNGKLGHVANIKYETGSDEVSGTGDQQAEKSWKRLERLGGDYTRPSAPFSLLRSSKGGENGQVLLSNVSQLIGQNQSIGLEDKKKFLKAVEKGLGGY